MDTVHFITITGIDHYYGKTPFEIGRIAKIAKEPENPHDPEAIRVELPVIGTDCTSFAGGHVVGGVEA